MQETVVGPHLPAAAGPESIPEPSGRLEERIASRALALIPGALVVYIGFDSGGFFPGTLAFVAVLLTQMILVRMLVSENPLAGVTRELCAVALLFAAFAGWTLASGAWSHSADRPLLEFDRALAFLDLLILFGLVPRRSWHVQWVVRGLVGGMFVVCTAALISRALPHVWPTDTTFARSRLSFPVSYWNALGILAGVGIILALGVTSSMREPRHIRALGAATIPAFAVTLLYTFSRGAIAATVIGLVIYVILAKPANVVGALLATIPTTVIAIVVAYHANLISTPPASITPAVLAQGRNVALAVGLCVLAAGALRLLAMRVDRTVAAFTTRPDARRNSRIAAVACGVAVVAAALSLGAPGWISRTAHQFLNGPSARGATDFRARLTDPSNNGRIELWRVSLKALSIQPLHGTGAGTYEFNWDRYRHDYYPVLNAHSVYLESLGDLGIVGFALLVGTLAGIIVALSRRLNSPHRALYAGLLAATIAWMLHATVDWDWEMPVTCIFIFAAGGLALARRAPPDGAPATAVTLPSRWRLPLAVALLFVCVAPALVFVSQFHLEASATALQNGDCNKADAEAVSSINVLASRPQPYEALGYCDLIQGRAPDAVAAMQKAVQREPGHWEYRYIMSVALAAAGRDPRPEIRKAVELDPGQPLARSAEVTFSRGRGPSWQQTAKAVEATALNSPSITLK